MPKPHNSNSSAVSGEERSRAVAEEARESQWKAPSFVRELFLGRFRLDLIHPYPEQEAEDRNKTERYMERLDAFLKENVDADETDRTGQIPPHVVEGLREIGAFGLKIPAEYGGIGLSQVGYGRVMQLVGAYDASLVALLSAHQSIGVPQPLKMFGTKEQKEKYLPRLARGAISAFALTEPGVGSDPAAMASTAVPSEDGGSFVLNGEKLWCTNGTVADLFVVMARTPPKVKNGREIPQITAFIVEADMPGVSVEHRCRFMGIRAIENAVVRFDNVRIPRENIILGEGKGLRLALATLNTGRLTIPMAAAASAKAAVKMCRTWATERVQWGGPVGQHDAVAQMLGDMTARGFAMEAMAELSSALADQAQNDIRLEAAIAKLWTTEVGWQLLDNALQIRGGRGFETADSLRERGEAPFPIERMLRDFRINRIFEGSSEIMRLFIAREAVDTHLSVAGALVDPRSAMKEKMSAFAKSGAFYATWLPGQFVNRSVGHYGEFGVLAKHLRFVERTSRKLARSTFYAMMRYQAKLEQRQSVLFRIVDIGSELFAISAACVRAESLRRSGRAGGEEAVRVADVFCRRSQLRIRSLFQDLSRNADVSTYKLAREVLRGEHAWFEEGLGQALDPLFEFPVAPGVAARATKTAEERAEGEGDAAVLLEAGVG